MSTAMGIPHGVAVAIDDLLDNCAEIEPGQEVVLMAHVDGLYGGDNVVDEQAIAWIQAAIQHRGAKVSVLWIDEPARPHAWRIPPVVRATLEACDVFINHSFDLTREEFGLNEIAVEHGTRLVRNFATTAPLLNTAWAQTPWELLAQIRYQASILFEPGKPFQLTDPNGTHLEGIIAPPKSPGSTNYNSRRKEGHSYRPFPEWMFAPINIVETSGIFIFDRMLSWWSRYIGIRPVFKDPIRLTIENNRITKIEGKEEAEHLRRFLAFVEPKVGNGIYNFPAIHSGIHPNTEVELHQCPNPLYRRLIEHSHASTVHAHIGAPSPTPDYPYWLHITADIRSATWQVGSALVHDKGRLTALDHPDVLAVAAKYPSRPGIKAKQGPSD